MHLKQFYKLIYYRIALSCLLAGVCLFTQSLRAEAQTSDAAANAANTNLVWPNAQSKANSDDWIRLHHQQIKQMQPRLLVLNFVNGLSNEEATKKAQALIAALRESSRYHGYAKANAPAFLDYKIYKVVDLTDPAPLPDDIRLDGNSSKYPRPPDWKPGMVNFQYSELYGDKFARYYNIPDPSDPARMLNLRELVERGIIHEVWFFANQRGNFGAPLECVESKQAYDDTMRKYPDRGGQAGAGVTDQQPFIGRSLRILFINPERGPGMALTALGRALENMATVGAIPYLSRYFREYAGFDLKKRFHLPFDRLYERQSELEYPEESTLAYVWKGERRTLHPYVPVGGSVEFMPTARHNSDLDSPASVLSTIEHYRLFDGPDGKDRALPWTNDRFARYRGVAPDGVGPWMVYWRQNMPGLDNPCKDDAGKPMLNWWPFLFY